MSITLEYPSSSPTTTLTLPNPTLGDNKQINVKTTHRRTMSGRSITHKRTPVATKLLLTFNILKDSDRTNLKSFLDTSKRESIKLTLHDSSVWIGKILVSPISLRKENTEQSSTTIEFEGIKQ